MKNKIMLNLHSELPLQEDGAGLFLKIMIAVSVFLFTLTLTGQMMIRAASDAWDKGVSESLTVQLKPAEKTLPEEEESVKINKVIQYFEQMPQVEKAALLSDRQMQRLMSPWLGQSVDPKTLPLPKLIDVRLKSGQALDLERVQKELSELEPRTSIDNHRMWLSKLMRFADALRLLAVSILALVLLCSAFSIFYATQTSLGIHSRIIEILHIIGATDDYIARQYAKRSFFMGLYAGILGLAAAFAAIYGIGGLAKGIDAGILAVPTLSLEDKLLMGVIPLGAALLSMLTAYGTVKKVLGKIM